MNWGVEAYGGIKLELFPVFDLNTLHSFKVLEIGSDKRHLVVQGCGANE